MGVHSSENSSPHSVAYKSPQREHSTATFCKKATIQFVQTLTSYHRGQPHFVSPSPPPSTARHHIPGGPEQRDFIHLQKCPVGQVRRPTTVNATGSEEAA